MFSDDWQRPPLPAQFALRVAILGGIGLVMFTIIFLRLWYLGVLSGDRYLAEAQNNQVREFTVQAPRGEILDSEGRPIVVNRTALELQVKPTELPRKRAKRLRVIERLGTVAEIKPERIRREIRRQSEELPASPVSLKRDVPYELVYYLRENQARFPGVSVERVHVRRYPQGTLAAHMLGYVREVDAEELKRPPYDGLEPGDLVGKDGVEYTYDSLLRGVNGATRVQVDAFGNPTGGQLSVREPRAGNDLVLSIDAKVQRGGEQALARRQLPGAFVAMEVDSGALLGLGSHPTYDPSIFARPVIPQSEVDRLNSEANGVPTLNRAILGFYPVGSTFKPITATAALASGTLTPQTVINDPGMIEIGEQIFTNAGETPHGSLTLDDALRVSSDVFFYTLGRDMNSEADDGGPLQEWAQKFGLGSPTGLDLLGEGPGLVPTPEWRNDLYREGLTDRPWSVGDNVQLAIGQGDQQANPLQMALAYAAIANGGEVVRPHVASRVTDPAGRVIQEIDPAPRRALDIDPVWQRTILDGLHGAAMEPGGTSYQVFGGYPREIAGKTGTAERPPREDQSWYVALAPYPDPEYVVAVTLEEGGFGAETAAPAAQEILNVLLDVKPQRIEQVSGGESAVTE
ncbi:MAG TPA: penicillin-binding protein 2 [Solirubrobacterales bacterium]|nr:penicillin-binding protein 2 [Solirubrobacterales bacterium]